MLTVPFFMSSAIRSVKIQPTLCKLSILAISSTRDSRSSGWRTIPSLVLSWNVRSTLKTRRKFVIFCHYFTVFFLYFGFITDLRWFINGNNDRAYTKRYVRVYLVSSVKITDALMSSNTPVIQESFNEIRILEDDVVDVTIRLEIERYCVRLTFAAYTAWPGRMIFATALNTTTYVL